MPSVGSLGEIAEADWDARTGFGIGVVVGVGVIVASATDEGGVAGLLGVTTVLVRGGAGAGSDDDGDGDGAEGFVLSYLCAGN